MFLNVTNKQQINKNPIVVINIDSMLKESMTSPVRSMFDGGSGTDTILVIHVMATGLKITGGVVTKSNIPIASQTNSIS